MTPMKKVLVVFTLCLLSASIVVGMCATNCSNLPDGTYPSCQSCDSYVTCFNSRTTIVFCMDGTLFDIELLACDRPELTTCGNESHAESPVTETSTTPTPTTSATTTTAAPTTTTTSATTATTATTTPAPTTATTTTPAPTTSPPTTSTTAPNNIQSGECVTDCTGMENGDYQSCTSCNMYVSCVHGMTYTDRQCAGSLVWDDISKMCLWSSTTCQIDGN